MKIVALNRRDFLKSSALVTGGLILGFENSISANVGKSPISLSPFLQITREGKIRLGVPVVEMGQGIYTALAMSVLEELNSDVNLIEEIQTIHHPSFKHPLVAKFTNDVLQMQITGGSASLKGWSKHFQRIGATCREMLLNAAKNYWKIDSDPIVKDGLVYHPEKNHVEHFGFFARNAQKLSVPKEPIIKLPHQFSLIGTSARRWDTEKKILGKAIFGADIKLDKLIYGTVINSPIIGSKINIVDDSKAKEIPGFIGIIPLERQVIVVAESTWTAMQAAKSLFISSQAGYPDYSDIDIINKLNLDSVNEGVLAGQIKGEPEQIFRDSNTIIERSYYVGMQAQASMEPLTATANVTKESCEFWGPVQIQDNPVFVAMQIAELPAEKIKVHTTFLGGGFGRKTEADFIIPPILASKIFGKPVQITWSREEDMQGGYYLPPCLEKIKVALDDKNLPLSLYAKVVSPSPSLHYAKAMGKFFPHWISEDGYDWVALEGMPQQPSLLTNEVNSENKYSIPNIKINYVPSEIPIQCGAWRGIGANANLFALESMIDEIAHYGGNDPINLRKILLKHSPRAINVLKEIEELSNWSEKREGRYLGFAYSDYLHTLQAQVAEIFLDSRNNVKVKKIYCVVDCGITHNPRIVHQQIEGGIIFGMTAALMSEINVKNGKIVQSNFDNYKMLRLKNTPKISIRTIDSNESPGGIGEAGTPLVGPAIANAVFAATGKRVRRLPIRKEDLA